MSTEEEDLPSESDGDDSDHGSAASSTGRGRRAAAAELGGTRIHEISDSVFEELEVRVDVAEEVQATWGIFLRAAESSEAAGEAIFGAIFDAAPSLQSLFKTPRAVMAMRFMGGLNRIVTSIGDPKSLKVIVETLGFQHMDLEVTIPRVEIFRDAILDLFSVELGARFTEKARVGWTSLLNYAGGAYIYVRLVYTDRLRILAASWATANKKEGAEGADGAEDSEGEGASGPLASGGDGRANGNGHANGNGRAKGGQTEEDGVGDGNGRRSRSGFFGWRRARSGTKSDDLSEFSGGAKGAADLDGSRFRAANVPTTYNDMFLFNAAVMGFSGSLWMSEVLLSFDTIVTNVSNSYRLQEECDMLSLGIARFGDAVRLHEYKAVMLASLRSLVPKDWNSEHEVAWTWLWENVENMLKAQMGKPAQQMKALEKLWSSLDDSQQDLVRREVYAKFFASTPAGQDYFKQSTTRLHFIADRIVAMTLEIYKDPKKMIEDISALGLRHVGYGIPTELFGPFVSACVQVVRGLTTDDVAVEAFRWSLSLISRILTRVISEGSTIVMKAINSNAGNQLKKAVSCAPRCERALWMLNIQVGTQSISPLLWALETGSLDAARAIIVDLLTIRADRDRYYYGMDAMFERHPDILKRLCTDAPSLLPTLLDGLIWRSRNTENGRRRVNYYVKHLVMDADGNFSKTLEWLVGFHDPKLVCHPAIVLVTDLVWSRLAFRTFLYSKSWFIFTLLVFVTAQAVMKHIDEDENTLPQRVAMASCRCFIYSCVMGQLIYYHVKKSYQDIREGRTFSLYHLHVPCYLQTWQDLASFLLTALLFLMFAIEPVVTCLQHSDGDFPGAGLFTEQCPDAHSTRFAYSVFSMIAMLLYFVLVIDLAVFSTRIASFVLVCGRFLSELALFLYATAFFVLTFSCVCSTVNRDIENFAGIFESGRSLVRVTLGMFSGSDYSTLHEEPAMIACVIFYSIASIVFLGNLLVAQLTCAYQASYEDMLGYARLNRGKIVMETMPSVPPSRWERFCESLRLDERCEFGEGDLGLTGAIPTTEAAVLNPITVEVIHRFGGTTSPQAVWPEAHGLHDEEDRFARIEKLIGIALKKLSRGKKTAKQGADNTTSLSMGSRTSSGSAQQEGHDSD